MEVGASQPLVEVGPQIQLCRHSVIGGAAAVPLAGVDVAVECLSVCTGVSSPVWGPLWPGRDWGTRELETGRKLLLSQSLAYTSCAVELP